MSPGVTAEEEQPDASSGAKAARSGQGVAGAQWVDVLKLVDPKKRGVVGKWQRREKEVLVSAVDAPARLPICTGPRGDYDLKMEFTRTDGDGTVGVILPVGPQQCMVAINYGGGASGIDMIDGRRADKNDSAAPGALANGRRFIVEIAVRLDQDETSVTATLDGRPLVFYRGPASALALHKQWGIGSRGALGLAANADVTLHRMDVRAKPAKPGGQ